MYKNTLFLGSKSAPRKLLLQQSGIPFITIEQNADEQIDKDGLTREQLVAAIAQQKMEHVILPAIAYENQTIFVLTADTLTQDSQGAIHGKPAHYDAAVAMIKGARNGMTLSTAFCLVSKIWSDNSWKTKDCLTHVVSAEYVIDLPDHLIDQYLKNSTGLQCAGGFAIEDGGLQFVKSVHGSFSTIMGLPLYEVRQALEKIGFFE